MNLDSGLGFREEFILRCQAALLGAGASAKLVQKILDRAVVVAPSTYGASGSVKDRVYVFLLYWQAEYASGKEQALVDRAILGLANSGAIDTTASGIVS